MPGNANSYPPANSTAAGVPSTSVCTRVAIPGISVQALSQQPPVGLQQPSGSSIKEARQRRRASKFDQPAGEPRAADHLSLPPPPPLHSSSIQEPLIQAATPVQGLSAQASLPLLGPPPAHCMSAGESAESMRKRAQAVAARFAAAAEEGSQAAAPAISATAQRPTALQQSAAAASEFEDDADPFKGLPPLPTNPTLLPRLPRPHPAGLSFSCSKADITPPAAVMTAAPKALPSMLRPILSGGMWPRPPQPPCGPPSRPFSGPRPLPGPYPAPSPPQYYSSHRQVRQAVCGLLQCLCSATLPALSDSEAALCDSLDCSLPTGTDRKAPGIAGTLASPPATRHTQLAGTACLGPQSRCRSSWPASIHVFILHIVFWYAYWIAATHEHSVARQLRMVAVVAALKLTANHQHDTCCRGRWMGPSSEARAWSGSAE